MLQSKPISSILFLDIEAVPQHKSFFEMSLRQQELFLKNCKTEAEKIIGAEMDDWDMEMLPTNSELIPKLEKLYAQKAPLKPEFLQICCISIGWFEKNQGLDDLTKIPDPDKELVFKSRSYYGQDEKKILLDFQKDFGQVIDKILAPSHYLCFYNSFMYDVPVLAKRYVINRLPLPAMFDLSDKSQPWQVPHILDPKVCWRMGQFDGNISLDLLCEVLGVQTSKGAISGKDVRDVYWEKGDVKSIAMYCQEDARATGECYLRMKGIYNTVITK